MKELRERGLIRSVHGKGTYVQSPPAERAAISDE
jgi:DNA-binding GntR family transcriptional regulator